MKKPKIKTCFITSAFPRFSCGVGDHVAKVAEELVAQGVEVFIITSKQIKVDPYYKNLGIKVYPRIERWDFAGWKKAYLIAKKLKTDIVHFEYPTRYPAGRSQILRFLAHILPFTLISWISGWVPKRVITIHEYYKVPSFVKLKILLDLWLSHRVIVVNRADEERLKKLTLNSKKIKFMPVGSNIPVIKKDPKATAEIRKKFAISPLTGLVCYFGFIDPSRGFEDLIQALKLLNQEKIHTKLLVIGGIKENSYIRSIKDKIRVEGLKNKIVFMGFVPDEKVAHYLQACDVAVQPFLKGATSNRSSLIASITLGVPTVSTYVAGITPNDFRNKQNMLLVPPGSAKELARGIKLLLRDKKLRKRVLEGMRKLAKTFTWKESAKQTSEVYESLL